MVWFENGFISSAQDCAARNIKGSRKALTYEFKFPVYRLTPEANRQIGKKINI